jgi:signal transduction histidine kinase
VEIEINISGEPVRLPAATEMNLLRISQEAVGNAVKHGQANHISVKLNYALDRVQLTVCDDGKGFEPGQVPSTGHFGLLDMQERAQSMGTRLSVETLPGQGSKISVEVAIRPQQLIDEEGKAHTYSGRG